MNKLKIKFFITTIILFPLLFSCGRNFCCTDREVAFPDFDIDGDGITNDTELDTYNEYTYGLSPDIRNTDLSRAFGSPDAGALEHGYNLKDDGIDIGTQQALDGWNYVHYLNDPVDSDDWGTGSLIYVLTLAAHNLMEYGSNEYKELVRESNWRNPSNFNGPLQIGDLSLKNGGPFVPHVSHQNGIDADLRYVRKGWGIGSLDLAIDPDTQRDGALDWDKEAQLNVFLAFADASYYIDKIFADQKVLDAVQVYVGDDRKPLLTKINSGHLNHFHVRIVAPELIDFYE